MELYDWQKQGVKDVISILAKENRACLAWYTGAGKTNVFSEICRRYAKPGFKIGISAFLTTEIKMQVYDRLGLFGLGDITHVVMPGVKVPDNKIIYVFNPQGLYRKEDVAFKFDLFIVDEGHTGLDENLKMLPSIRSNYCTKKTKMLIVSATPWDIMAMKEFEGITVLKRPIDQGLEDGLITDYTFHAEEAQITFTEDDFNRKGDLKLNATRIGIMKSACIGKVAYIVDNFKKEVGDKCMVICPHGSYGEVARELQERFGGVHVLDGRTLDKEAKHVRRDDPSSSLNKFITDPTCKFLFVVNKCQTGFDMKGLSSVIDLTMSRNIKSLAQRTGRIARKNGRMNKHYFYVYDKSLMKNQLEWIVTTMIDFTLGAYDGWTTKSAKHRQVSVQSWEYREPWSTTLLEVVRALRSPKNVHTARTLKYVNFARPTNRTLAEAKEQAKAYENRTDMWSQNPALYKWFRLYAKSEMDKIFPLRHHFGKWNEATVIAAMKKCKSRNEFARQNSGASGWVLVNKRQDLKDKYLPPSKSQKYWNKKSVLDLLQKTRSWTHLRNYSGARAWMRAHGGDMKWRKFWCELHGRDFKTRSYKMVRETRKKSSGEAAS